MKFNNQSSTNRIIILLVLVFALGLIAVGYIVGDLKDKEEAKQQFRLEEEHDDARAKVIHSIDNFATLVSGIRAYIDSKESVPEVYELRGFVGNLLEDIRYQDSIIVSYLDTNHTFVYTFSRTEEDPAGLKGINVADIRDQDEIDQLDRIMKDHELHLFEPINLVEGWAGIPLNFGVHKNGRSVGYIASLVNFKTIIDPVYQNSNVAEDIAFKFSIVDGPVFDRQTVYDGSKVYNADLDQESFFLFDIEEEDIIYSDIEKYGTVLRLGTAYKEKPRTLTLTIFLIYAFYFAIFSLLVLMVRQLYVAQRANKVLQEAKEIAERTAEAKHSFLVNLSHEIRTPLNAIIGFAGLIQATDLDQAQAKHANTISVASKSLLKLINDVLDISKIESGTIELEKRGFSIREVLQDVMTINSEAAKAKKLKLRLNIDSDLPEFLLGDPGRLSQILLNLLGNSIKFTHEGYIEMRLDVLSSDTDHAVIKFTVADTGIGIPKDKQEQIFERFTQADSSTTRMYGGTGLGLNIFKELVELHGGDIDIKSVEGEGTEFIFVIDYPIAGKADSIETEISDEAAMANLAGIKILLAEDNEHNQVLACTYLERNGAEVDIAENGQVAVNLMRRNTYNCILMDLQMPIMDGFQTTRHIRGKLNSDIPIIACTAHFLASEKIKSLETGMNGYLTKPYTEHQLINTVSDFTTGFKPILSGPDVLDDAIESIASTLEKMEEKEGREFVERLMTIFNERIPDDIISLRSALDENQEQLLQNKAHLLAGSLGSLQMQEGYKLAQQVEELVTKNEFEKSREPAEALISYLKETLEITKKY